MRILSTFIFFLCLAVFTNIYAQKTLKGLVTYKLIDDSQPLSGVQVKANKSNPKITTTFGEFDLVLSSYNPREELIIQVIKPGYEVVNKHELRNPNPDKLLRIVMCKIGERDKWARKYYDLAEDAIYEKYEAAQKKIKELELNNKNRESEIEKLENELKQSLSYAKKFSQELADKNLEETTPLYKSALKYFVSGEIDSARLVFELADLDIRDKKNSKDRLFYAQLLTIEQRYTEAEKNFRKAIYLYEDFENFNGYANYLFELGFFNQAAQFYSRALQFANTQRDSAVSYERLGTINSIKNSYTKETSEYFQYSYNYWETQIKKYGTLDNISELHNCSKNLFFIYRQEGKNEAINIILNFSFSIIDSALYKSTINAPNDLFQQQYLNAKLYFYKGELYQLLSKYHQAKEAYKNAIAILNELSESNSNDYLADLANAYKAQIEAEYKINQNSAVVIASQDSLLKIYSKLNYRKFRQKILDSHFTLASLNLHYNPVASKVHSQKTLTILQEIIEEGYYSSIHLEHEIYSYFFLGFASMILDSRDESFEYLNYALNLGEKYIEQGFVDLHDNVVVISNTIAVFHLNNLTQKAGVDSTALKNVIRYNDITLKHYENDPLLSDTIKEEKKIQVIKMAVISYNVIEDYESMLKEANKAFAITKHLRKEIYLTETIEALSDIAAGVIIYYRDINYIPDSLSRYADLWSELNGKIVPFGSKQFLEDMIDLGWVYYYSYDWVKSIRTINLAIDYINTSYNNLDSNFIAASFYNYGVVLFGHKDYHQALSFLNESLNIYKNIQSYESNNETVILYYTSSYLNLQQKKNINTKKVKPYRDIENCYYRIANLYYEIGDYKKARIYLDSIFYVINEAKDSLDLDSKILAANIYAKLSDKFKSLEYLSEIKAATNFLLSASDLYYYLPAIAAADPEFTSKNIKKNIKKFDTYLKPWITNLSKDSITITKGIKYYQLALAYYNVNNYNAALSCIKSAIDLYIEFEPSGNLRLGDFYITASKIAASTGNYTLAVSYAEKALEVFRINVLIDNTKVNEALQLLEKSSPNAVSIKQEKETSEKNDRLYQEITALFDKATADTVSNRARSLYQKAIELNQKILSTQRFERYITSIVRLYEELYELETGIVPKISLLDSIVNYRYELINKYSYDKNSENYKECLHLLSNSLGSLSWYLILRGAKEDIDRALICAKNGLNYDISKRNSWIEINLFWSYLFQGKKDLAEEALDYCIHKEEELSDGSKYIYWKVLEEDLYKIRYLNLTHPDLEYFAEKITNQK